MSTSTLVIPKSGYARWTFKTDKNRFKSMGASVNQSLENAYRTVLAATTTTTSSNNNKNKKSGLKSITTVKSGDGKYLIDFEKMQQQNLDTDFIREIRREFVIKNKDGSIASVVTTTTPPHITNINTAAATSSQQPQAQQHLGKAPKRKSKALSSSPTVASRTQQIREQMKCDTMDAFTAINQQVENLSCKSEKERVLARSIFTAHSTTHSTECSQREAFSQKMKPIKETLQQLKKDHQAERSRVIARQCRRELALDLAKLMYEDHANSTALVPVVATNTTSSSSVTSPSQTQKQEMRMKKRADETFQEIKKQLPSRSDPLFERLVALSIVNLLLPFTTIRKSNLHKYSDHAMQIERDRVVADKACRKEIRDLVRVKLNGKRQVKTSKSLRKALGNNLARLMVDETKTNGKW